MLSGRPYGRGYDYACVPWRRTYTEMWVLLGLAAFTIGAALWHPPHVVA